MARVFISFAGIAGGKEPKPYQEVSYHWQGRGEHTTRYVQAAVVTQLGATSFDRLVVLGTKTSRPFHEATLRAELEALGVSRERCYFETISEDVADFGQQWAWFEALLAQVDVGDHLVLDMTLGHRTVPIVFSSAIGYLQRLKRVVVEHVVNGALERGTSRGAIVDMRDFAVVQDWAEAVGRLVDTADARLLAQLAAAAPAGSTFARLGSPARTPGGKAASARTRTCSSGC